MSPSNSLPSMDADQDLYINLDLPGADAVLRQLDPDVRVQIYCTRNHQSISLLPMLVNCTNVVSICVETTYRSADDCCKLTRPLKQVLLSCPSLRQLSLNISPPRTGCVIPNAPSEYCGLGFANGERPPALESLDIIAYPWGYEPNDSPHNIHAIGYPEKGKELEYWTERFDWSRLRRLSDSSSDLAMHIASKLTALDEITFSPNHDPCGMRSFFLNVPSMLSVVRIPVLGDIGMDAILRHGDTLRKLEIHHTELLDKINEQELLQLRDMLPNLDKLSLDIDRAGNEWPFSLLGTLASFPSLRKLDVYLELGHDSDAPACPYLTASSAAQLCKYMCDRSATLQRLHLHSGCPPQIGYGFLTEEIDWRAENSTSFICEAAKQGPQQFLMTCPKLDEHLNKEMRAALVSGANKAASLPQGHKVSFKVAIEGPLPMEEWIPLHRQDEVWALGLHRRPSLKQRWTGFLRGVKMKMKPST